MKSKVYCRNCLCPEVCRRSDLCLMYIFTRIIIIIHTQFCSILQENLVQHSVSDLQTHLTNAGRLYQATGRAILMISRSCWSSSA